MIVTYIYVCVHAYTAILRTYIYTRGRVIPGFYVSRMGLRFIHCPSFFSRVYVWRRVHARVKKKRGNFLFSFVPANVIRSLLKGIRWARCWSRISSSGSDGIYALCRRNNVRSFLCFTSGRLNKSARARRLWMAGFMRSGCVIEKKKFKMYDR